MIRHDFGTTFSFNKTTVVRPPDKHKISMRFSGSE